VAIRIRRRTIISTHLDAGATGAMTGAGYPDGIRAIVDAHFAGDRERAAAAYQCWLPLINYENRQCGLTAAATAPGNPCRPDRDRAPARPGRATMGQVRPRRRQYKPSNDKIRTA